MSSNDVLRIPVDNDPDVRSKIIPALVKRHTREVGPVPHGKGGEPSASFVIRWAMAETANPRRRSTTNVGIENDVARSMIDDMQIELVASRKDVTSLQSELAGSAILMDSMAAEVARLTQRAEAAESKAVALDSKLTDAACELVNAHTGRVDAEEALDAAGRELAMANGRVAAVETIALALRTELGALRAASSSAATASDGARLKAAREAAGMSQSALAAHLGYAHKSSIGLAERGRAPLSASMAAWLEGQER